MQYKGTPKNSAFKRKKKDILKQFNKLMQNIHDEQITKY